MRRGAPCALGDRSSGARPMLQRLWSNEMVAGLPAPVIHETRRASRRRLWRSRELLSCRLASSWSVCALCLRVPLDQREEFFFRRAQAWKRTPADLLKHTLTPLRPWRSRADPLLRGYFAEVTQLFASCPLVLAP